MATERDIAALHLAERYALGTDDVVGKITKIYAAGGRETRDHSKARSVVVVWPDGTWTSADLRLFNFRTQLH